MTAAITEGEVLDFRTRLTDAEKLINENIRRTDVHEEKCAGRYRLLIILVSVSILVNVPGALPHLSTFLSWVK